MRKSSSATTIDAVLHCVYSVNDLAVAYVTAYVDPEDPPQSERPQTPSSFALTSPLLDASP